MESDRLFPRRPLQDVADVIDSLHATPSYADVGLPMVRVTDVKEGFLSLDACVKVSEEVFVQFTRNHVPVQGDIVISRVGTYGVFSYVQSTDRFCLGQNTAVIHPHESSRFIYYALRSPETRHLIEERVVGSTQKTLSLRHIRGLPIPFPPLSDRTAIAAALGALDDKIEQNRRTGRALEALARATFKAWFVDFEPVKAKGAGQISFPGMPRDVFAALPDRLTDSPLGPAPQGWAISSFGSVMSESNARNRGETIKLVFSAVSSGELARSDEHFNKQVYSKSLANYKVVQPGAIAFNPSRVNIGSIGINHRSQAGVVSPVYVVCSMQRELEWFFEFYLRLPTSRERFVTLSSGSVRQSLRAVDFLSIELVLPDRALLLAFNEWYESIRALNDALTVESSKLAGLRDYLLPELLSGRLRVRSPLGEVCA